MSGTELFSPELYYLSQLPAEMNVHETVIVAVMSLVLSFLSLRFPFPFADKRAALQQALELNWVPLSMKRRIEECYK